MSGSVLIVACARVESSRFPSKIKSQVCGTNALHYQLEKLHTWQAHGGLPWVLATTTRAEDDWCVAQVVELLHSRGGWDQFVHRGQDDSPLERMIAAAEERGAEHVVRHTHDDLFYDRLLLDDMIADHLASGAEVTTCRHTVDAFAPEVYQVSALRRIHDAYGKLAAEMIGHYLGDLDVRDHEPYKSIRVEDRQEFRLELDWPEDLLKIRVVLGALGAHPSSEDVLAFLRDNPNVNAINASRRKAA